MPRVRITFCRPRCTIVNVLECKNARETFRSFLQRLHWPSTLSSFLLTHPNLFSIPCFLVKLNEIAEPSPEAPQEDIVISTPTNGRRVPVDWSGSNNSSPLMSSSGGPPALPPKNNLTMAPKRNLSAKKVGAGSPAHSRANSASSTGSYGSGPSSIPDYSAMHRSSSNSGLQGVKQTASKRPLVFGASLKIATSDATGAQIHTVPPIIPSTIEVIRKKGLKEEGIFRIGGSHSAMQQYKARFDAGENVDLTSEPDVNNVSGLLKMYLRELPEHLFTDHLMPLFQNAYANYDPHAATGDDQASEVVAQLLPLLPETNLLILQELFGLLQDIVKLANINKMTSQNLGIIFTQCLRIDGTFFQFLMQRPHLLQNAKPTITQSTQTGDLIQW